MATVFSYDSAQNPTTQPLLTANQQVFLSGAANAVIASGSNAVGITSFTGTQTLNVVSTSAINLNATPDQNFWQYVGNVNTALGLNLSPANIDGFLFVATSAGIALVSYQGLTSTSFTNVKYISGQAGTLATGGSVVNATQEYFVMTGVASRITGSIYSDQGGTLTIIESFDGVNWDIGNTITVTAGTVGSGINQETIAPYLAFLYSNGAAAQGVFRFHIRVFGNGRQGA
jgi:hypothetical protein